MPRLTEEFLARNIRVTPLDADGAVPDQAERDAAMQALIDRHIATITARARRINERQWADHGYIVPSTSPSTVQYRTTDGGVLDLGIVEAIRWEPLYDLPSTSTDRRPVMDALNQTETATRGPGPAGPVDRRSWTSALRVAALAEGWGLHFPFTRGGVEVIGDDEQRAALYRGDGEHNRIARLLLRDGNPDEYERCRRAAEESETRCHEPTSRPTR